MLRHPRSSGISAITNLDKFADESGEMDNCLIVVFTRITLQAKAALIEKIFTAQNLYCISVISDIPLNRFTLNPRIIEECTPLGHL